MEDVRMQNDKLVLGIAESLQRATSKRRVFLGKCNTEMYVVEE